MSPEISERSFEEAIEARRAEGTGGRAIRRGVLVRRYGLSDRQGLALDRVLEQGRLTIQELEALCPGVNRRTLQRDLREMIDKGLLATAGRTNRLEYIAGKGVT